MERLLLDEENKEKHINKLLKNLLSQSVSTAFCFIFNQLVKKHKNKIMEIIQKTRF